MSQHIATVRWSALPNDEFAKGKYSRQHEWVFDGGLTIPASAAPAVVPLPWSNPNNVDPEEALVAAASSCHMLTFLWLASRAGFLIASYEDSAIGTMSENDRGSAWISNICLSPRISWTGSKIPSDEEIAQLHHQAHEECFIANSIKATVEIKTN